MQAIIVDVLKQSGCRDIIVGDEGIYYITTACGTASSGPVYVGCCPSGVHVSVVVPGAKDLIQSPNLMKPEDAIKFIRSTVVLVNTQGSKSVPTSGHRFSESIRN